MTLFDKVLINLHRGYERLIRGSALVSERARFEMNLVRMRMRIEHARTTMQELYARIGRRAVSLHRSGDKPRSFDAFMKDGEVAAMVKELVQVKAEMDETAEQLAREQEEIIEAAKVSEDTKT